MAFDSASGIASEPLLHAVLVAGIAALGAALLLIGGIIALRIAGVSSRAAASRVTARWRPRFAGAIAGATDRLPVPAARRETRPVLRLFVQYALALQGPGAAQLAAYGRACGLRQLALRLLAHRATRDRLLAIEALGHLGEPDSSPALLAFCVDPNPIVSHAAARALLRIDPANAAHVIPHAVEREDWPVARLLPALKAAGAPVAAALAAAIRGARPDRLPRALSLARVLPASQAASFVRRFLADSRDPEVMIACLKLLQDPRDADFARRAAGHREWAVRVAAVNALARVATEGDLPRLTKALGDPVWWVRQRAAEALVRLPFFNAEQLERLRGIVTDRYARDALARAIAERRFQ